MNIKDPNLDEDGFLINPPATMEYEDIMSAMKNSAEKGEELHNEIISTINSIEHYIDSIRNEINFNDDISTSCITYNLDEIGSLLRKLLHSIDK